MRIITQRNMIRGVVKRWDEQYPEKSWKGTDKEQIHIQLQQLDLEIATADEVNKIIGNTSWTEEACDECGKAVDKVIVFGQEEYGSSSIYLCFRCIEKGARMMGAYIFGSHE